jgi:hypothetical protein
MLRAALAQERAGPADMNDAARGDPNEIARRPVPPALIKFRNVKLNLGGEVSELFGTRTGLGYLLMDAQTKGRIDIVFAVCLLIIGSCVVGDKLIIEPLSRHYRAGK